eukprot:TRINITY_DN13174_c0_g1_i1.p1 TRINITY_DN13174_c0_g1~~TRINITY_DN13174_c0_g1_i1.p1  ORF type:complete len:231 (+),score=60.81 TRINITY_DN13174_c0_g1_i1:31-693(+)
MSNLIPFPTGNDGVTAKEEEDGGWCWVDEVPQDHHTSPTGALTIAITKGGLWKETFPNNVLLKPLPGATATTTPSFSITTTLRLRPAVSGEQAGLLLYFDKANYLKANVEYLNKEAGKLWAVFARTKDGESTVLTKVLLQEGKEEDVQLRFIIDEGVASASFSAFAVGSSPSSTFTELASESLWSAEAPLRFGLYATAYEEVNRSAVFSDFSFTLKSASK